jgi:hypothetical protein
MVCATLFDTSVRIRTYIEMRNSAVIATFSWQA